MLGLLLLHANQVVSIDQFVDALWGETPPRSYRVVLRELVAQLRSALGSDRSGGGLDDIRVGALIETKAPGYRLHISPVCVDLEEFRRDVAAARERMGDGDPASAAARASDVCCSCGWVGGAS